MLNRPQPASGPAWVQHRDTCGISLEMPSAWRLRIEPSVDAPGELEVSDPRGTAAAMLRARRMPADRDLARWLRLDYPATEAGLHNVIMLRVDRHGPQLASAAFDYGSQVFSGRAQVVAMRHNDMAVLLVAAAARAEFPQRLPDLIRILGSMRVRGLVIGQIDLERLMTAALTRETTALLQR